MKNLFHVIFHLLYMLCTPCIYVHTTVYTTLHTVCTSYKVSKGTVLRLFGQAALRGLASLHWWKKEYGIMFVNLEEEMLSLI
jgi:hypothetical protein